MALPSQTKCDIPSTTSRATSITCFLYLITGIFGYFTFYDILNGNILVNYSVTDWLAVVSRCAFALLLLVNFPQLTGPLQLAIDRYSRRDGSSNRHMVISLIFSTLALLVAFLINDLSVMVDLVGATASTLTSFVLPGLCALQLLKRADLSTGISVAWIKMPALLLVLVGLWVMLVSLLLIFAV